MVKPAYYNEIEPYAAAWLRNLIAAGHIAPGDVDERDIRDVQPDDLRGYAQCHFFAGIGVWSYALRRAGWPDDREIWTGSCPCQPFSAAGAGLGFVDERHLWPHFHWLIQECRPAVVAGEQVASKDSEPWIDLVQDDLEALGYAFGAVAFPAASVGAPHIRDRLYWVGDARSSRLEGHTGHGGAAGWQGSGRPTAAPSVPGWVADNDIYRRPAASLGELHHAQPDAESRGSAVGLADTERVAGRAQAFAAHYGGSQANGPADRAGGCGGSLGGLADAGGERRQQDAGSAPCDEEAHGGAGRDGQQPDGDHVAAGDVEVRGDEQPRPTHGFWRDADWVLCRDGKFRPVEPGTQPLVDGSAGDLGRVRAGQERLAALRPRKDQGSRTGRLKGYGNAINGEAAIAFIEAAVM